MQEIQDNFNKRKKDRYLRKSDIAVVGMACRFPGAEDYTQFWNNLVQGVVSVSEIPPSPHRWDTGKYYSPKIEETNKTLSKWGGLIEGIDLFDNRFFNISPREAKNMDPQQRILIEETWHCFEDAGVSLYELQQRKTSVYIGVMTSDYHQALSSPDVIIDSYAGLGNYDCILANRLSFFYNLRGVSMAVDAACASSLVAIHEARHSLMMEESDYALAGGVNLTCHPWKYISFSKSRMLSPDGRCKTFDKDANGYVPGEGIAVLLLQRLEDAYRAGNHIYGIIKGTAVNHGGRTKSITAPRVESQQDVILAAYRNAGLAPGMVSYVEAHGTGTTLGDPIEVEALTKAFREYIPLRIDKTLFKNEILKKVPVGSHDYDLLVHMYHYDKRDECYIIENKYLDYPAHLRKELFDDVRLVMEKVGFLNTKKNQFCAIGSVKTNIGHLEAAAGVAGIIKVLLMLIHHKIPPSLNISSLNPIIKFEESPFKVARELSDWELTNNDQIRRASVSSFGFGGVNSHAIVEEFKERRSQRRGLRKHNEYFFMLSAKSPASLQKLIEKWKKFVDTPEFASYELYDICSTLMVGRMNLIYRYGFVIKNKQELKKWIRSIGQVQTERGKKPCCLRIGDCHWQEIQRIHKFLNKNHYYARHFNDLRKYFSQQRSVNFFKSIMTGQTVDEDVTLLNFMQGYAYLQTLFDYGFKPDLVTAEGSGVLLGLVLCGVLKVGAAIELLDGRLSWDKVSFNRPVIPYYDACTTKTAMPFHFTREYLVQLMEGVDLSAAELAKIFIGEGQINTELSGGEKLEHQNRHLGELLVSNGYVNREQLNEAIALHSRAADSYRRLPPGSRMERDMPRLGRILVEKGYCTEKQLSDTLRAQKIIDSFVHEPLIQFVNRAWKLNTGQYTYKRYLEEWESTLKKRGVDIIKLINDKTPLEQDEQILPRHRLLLLVIFVTCMYKLGQKWDLSDKPIEENNFFFEFIELIADGVLTKEAVIDLINDNLTRQEDEDSLKRLAVILHEMNVRQSNIKPSSLLKFFRQAYPKIRDIKDKGAWFNTAVSLKETLNSREMAYHKVEHIHFVQVGQFTATPGVSSFVDLRISSDLGKEFKENLLLLWNCGQDIKWDTFFPGFRFNKAMLPTIDQKNCSFLKHYRGVDFNRVVLPTYPFDRRSFWLEKDETLMERYNLNGRKDSYRESKLTQEDRYGLVFSRVYTVKDAILRDYILNGVHILPAAALIEAGLEAVRRALSMKQEDVNVLCSLTLGQKAILARQLRLDIQVWRREVEQNFVIREGMTCLCKGHFQPVRQFPPPAPDLSNVINSEDHMLELGSLYPTLGGMGYGIGKSLQVIGKMWKNEDQFIVELNELAHAEGRITGLSPFLLAGAIQAVLAVQFTREEDNQPLHMYLPYTIGKLILHDRMPSVCYAVFSETGLLSRGEGIVVDFKVYADSGKPLLEVEELVLRRVERRVLFHEQELGIGDVHFYRPCWKEKAPLQGGTEKGPRVAFVLAEKGELLQALSGALQGQYKHIFRFVPGDDPGGSGEGIFAFNPEQEYDYTNILKDIFIDLDGHYNGCDIFHLLSLHSEPEVKTAGDLLNRQVRGLRSLYYLLKVLATRPKLNGNIRCLVATLESQVVRDGDRAPGFIHGSLDGFGKTLMLELSRLKLKTLDFDRTTRDAVERVAGILCEEIQSCREPEVIAFRKGIRLVRELGATVLGRAGEGTAIRPGGVYLIVGGAGGIGLKIAGLLAGEATATIVLAGRREEDAGIREKIEGLEKGSSRVVYRQVDVTSYEQVNVLMREIIKEYGGIHGIVHAGGVLADKIFRNKQWDEFWGVMAGKVLGAWNLHSVTRNEELDFFILFSSVVSEIGNIGQTDYAAANSFLDRFAEWRRAGGFNGKSIAVNWTLWSDGGMGLDETVKNNFRRRSGLISSEQGVDAFRKILDSDVSRVIVTGKGFVETVPPGGDDLSAPGEEQSASRASLKSGDSGADQVCRILTGILAETIDSEEDELEKQIDLREYGMDSVGFTEFAEKINNRLQTSINPTLFFEYTSIQMLAGYILENYPLPGLEIQPQAEGGKTAGTPDPEDIGGGASRTPESLITLLNGFLSSILECGEDVPDSHLDLREYGMDSVGFTELAEKINSALRTSLNPAVFFEYPTTALLAEYILDNYGHVLDKGEESVAEPRPGIVIDESCVVRHLADILAQIIETSPQELDVYTDMREYGMDSVGFTELSEKINFQLNTAVNPTLFFEYPTLQELATYLIENYDLNLMEENVSPAPPAGVHTPPASAPLVEPETTGGFGRLPESRPEWKEQGAGSLPTPQQRETAIAVVGMSGRFPGADDCTQFWNNLLAGKDMISEIPADRWDWQEYWGDAHGDENKTDCKWGGFLTDIRRFDARFFRISPREAELMDPQQRLLLEEVWHAIEDSGQPPDSFSGTKTGVFIGVCNDDYNELLVKNNVRLDAYASTGTDFCLLPNRISYLLNIHGPSVAIDTACSSSLVAIHQAVSCILNGDCEMAIAGGVNVICSPNRYISLSHAGVLSTGGRCRSFAVGADGYVRAEGIGIILLKPLEKALTDRNPVYGIIKGSGVNHGGFSTSLTAPNPNAQADLLVEAYQKAGINPATISYLEAHGTGTSLGDPIEINGMKKAFTELYNLWQLDPPKKPHCAIGSVKTKVGHLEGAAGITGVIKVLLAMRYGQLPGLLHFREQNPYIDLKGSPFYFVSGNTTWQHLTDKQGRKIPRRAGVSSFGFGGANGHVILEEYIPPVTTLPPVTGQVVIVLSAKDDERLKASARFLADFLENEHSGSLAEIAYTLQTGREAHRERLALIAGDEPTLSRNLREFARGKLKIPDLFRGDASGTGGMSVLVDGRAGRKYLQTVVEDRELNKLAQLWVGGVKLDWEMLYPLDKPARVSLPGYPFGGEAYWIGTREEGLSVPSLRGGGERLHRLIESNNSTLREQRFTTHFTGNEFFLKDHQVSGHKVLPGVACLEMARAAGEIALEGPVRVIRNIVWLRPIVVNGRMKKVHITFKPEKDRVNFEINSHNPEEGKILHCQGRLEYECRLASPLSFRLDEIISRCGRLKPAAECYDLFQRTGLNYGAGFRGIRVLHCGRKEAVAEIQLPSSLHPRAGDFMLHPSLMDCALQSVIGIIDDVVEREGVPFLPYAIGRVDVRAPLPERCYAYVEMKDTGDANKGDGMSFDVWITDSSGQVLVGMQEFYMRAWKSPAPGDGALGRKRRGKQKLDDKQVLMLLRKLKNGELNTEQADQLIGGYYE